MGDWDEWSERIGRAFEALENADYYTVLGVERGADVAVIRSAYYGRARQLHPDRLVGAPEPGRSKAAHVYKRVVEAYQTLSDPVLRQVYDRTLGEGQKRLVVTSRLSLKPRQDGWFLATEGGRKHYLAAKEALAEGNRAMAKLNLKIAIRHEGEVEELEDLMHRIEEGD